MNTSRDLPRRGDAGAGEGASGTADVGIRNDGPGRDVSIRGSIIHTHSHRRRYNTVASTDVDDPHQRDNGTSANNNEIAPGDPLMDGIEGSSTPALPSTRTSRFAARLLPQRQLQQHPSMNLRQRQQQRTTYSRIHQQGDMVEMDDHSGRSNSSGSIGSTIQVPPVTVSSGTSMGSAGSVGYAGLAVVSAAAAGNNEINHEGNDDDDGTRISVIILDFAQKKFPVPVHPTWSVSQLKQAGAAVHKVPIDRQRLIFRGKLLLDEMPLKDVGIVENDMIVHLFPKPRVVITNSNANSSSSSKPSEDSNPTSDANANADQQQNDGARVPTIVMDAEEAERRSQILVLGSVEYIEAQNNVKLFSFMLLIISSIELLNLLALALGVQQEDGNNPDGDGGGIIIQDDDIFPSVNDYYPSNFSSIGRHNMTTKDSDMAMDPALQLYSQWGLTNYVDLAISALGVYVAFMGIKASTENTLKLARLYLLGTAVVGVSWVLFNYYMSAQINELVEQEHEQRDDDVLYPKYSQDEIYKSAFQVMVLPSMVWILCCFRAWQFQRLLEEAEVEAVGRVRHNEQDNEDGVGDPASRTISHALHSTELTPTRWSRTNTNTQPGDVEAGASVSGAFISHHTS